MPGGYGTVDTPWGTAGDRGPVKSPVSTPSRQITLPPVVSDAEIAASGTQQPTTQFANIPSGNIPGTPLICMEIILIIPLETFKLAKYYQNKNP